RHTHVMAALLAGDLELARKRLDKWLAADRNDPENDYMLAVIECKAGNVPAAVEAMERAIKLGMPPERFVAGTHTMLDPLKKTPEFEAISKRLANRVVSGPMLADVTDTSAQVWVRTATP